MIGTQEDAPVLIDAHMLIGIPSAPFFETLIQKLDVLVRLRNTAETQNCDDAIDTLRLNAPIPRLRIVERFNAHGDNLINTINMAKDSPVNGDSTHSNVTAPRPVQKRKREPARTASNKSARTGTPNAYARRSPPREARPISSDDDGDAPKKRAPARRRSPSGSPPRQLKRPGAGARFAREQAQHDDGREIVLADALAHLEVLIEHGLELQGYGLIPGNKELVDVGRGRTRG